MSFEIDKIYTDNPYVDEMVYYTKLMGIDTVLKMQDIADKNEDLESLKRAELYISCIENTVTFNMFDSYTETALISGGVTDPTTLTESLLNKNNIPISKRDSVLKAMKAEYIENYEELNTYYRMLHGLPAIGVKDYVEDWIAPDGISIDLSKPIHEMTQAEVTILDKYGVLDKMINEDPVNREYMRHLGKKSIDYYTARRANRFDALYIPTINSESIQKMYKDRLDANKFYVLRTIYSEAYKYDSDYYDNFIAILIVIITMVDIISRVQEFIARKEIFDIRSVQYIFKSYGVPFFENIPLKYQIAMVKNLHTLLKYKSTSKCMVDICSLFGFSNIKIFKYYILRDRKIDLSTGEYLERFNEDGTEDIDSEYELKFLKLPLEDDVDEYVGKGTNYIDYDEITEMDPKWDGGLDHDQVKSDILKNEFNINRTKYISIDTINEIAKMSAQQSYFFNFLYDNVEMEDMVKVRIPYIDPSAEFKLADIFTLLTSLSYQYNGIKDTIMDTQSKVLYVNGFNFKVDLATLAEEIGPKIVNGILIDAGSTIHAREQLSNFEVPTSPIPSFNEMMNIFINNMKVRDELIKGMQEADNLKVYKVYEKLYNALMTVELTMDHFKNPETGDFYRDADGDATYSEYLKHEDPSLYSILLDIENFDDEASKNQYIGNLIDSVVYALEEYIDSNEFSALFSNLPIMSSEAVKQYIATVINFYKSYKVDFLGLNTLYILDDKNEGYIRLIDDLLFNRYYDKNEFLSVVDRIADSMVDMTKEEKMELKEKIYRSTNWIESLDLDEIIKLDDKISRNLVTLSLYSVIQFNEDYIIKEITE